MSHVLLSKTLTRERADELIEELGFLGICDLVYVLADKLDGGIECKGHRVVVKIKPRPRVKKVKMVKKVKAAPRPRPRSSSP